MKIAIVGGGPAGLYLGYLLKRDHSRHSVDIFEQNPLDNTWGFGVVFSDRALDFLKIDDLLRKNLRLVAGAGGESSPERFPNTTKCQQVYQTLKFRPSSPTEGEENSPVPRSGQILLLHKLAGSS